MKRYRILDCTWLHRQNEDDPPILLDGHGNQLPIDAEPVWLDFTFEQALFAANSLGEKFYPPVNLDNDGAALRIGKHLTL